MSNNGDAEVFQVLLREVRQDGFVYLILAECRLILPEARARPSLLPRLPSASCPEAEHVPSHDESLCSTASSVRCTELSPTRFKNFLEGHILRGTFNHSGEPSGVEVTWDCAMCARASPHD